MKRYEKGGKMRKVMFFLLSINILFSYSQQKEYKAQEKEEKNQIIYYEDFENINDFKELKSWQRIDSPSRVEIDNKVSHSDEKSLKISFDSPIDFNFYHVIFNIKIQPDTEYTFLAYVKTELESGDIGFEVIDKRGFNLFCKSSKFLNGVNDWSPLYINFTTPSDSEEIIIRVRHYGSDKPVNKFKGTIWIDDIKLVKGKIQVEKYSILKYTISIDGETIKKELKDLLGIGYDPATVYRVLLNPEKNEISEDYLTIFKEYPFHLVHWAGGPANHYKWKYSIGPIEERKPQEKLPSSYKKEFGILEFIRSVTLINPETKFIWVMNILTETPRDNADLVEFLTGDEKTLWGKKRIELGLKRPVNISIYALGSELDTKLEVNEYVKKCKENIKEIKKVQPEAKFIAIAATKGFYPMKKNDKTVEWEDWHRIVLKELKDEIDYIDFHTYYGSMKELERYLDILSNDIKEITGGDRIKIFIGEHAVWPHWDDRTKPWNIYWYRTHSLAGCLATANWIIRMANRRDISIAMYHNFSSGPWGLTYRERGKLYTTGIFDLFRILNEAIGNNSEVLKFSVEGERDVQLLTSSCCVIKRKDSGINILLVNQEELMNQEELIGKEINFKFPEGKKYVLKEEIVLTGEKMDSYNKVDKKEIFIERKKYKDNNIFNSYFLDSKRFVVLKLDEFKEVKK